MAIDLVAVRNKHTGQKTLMSASALGRSTDFEKTPRQKSADTNKPAISGTTKEK